MKKRKRTYVQRARREQQAETRARIVDAIMRLHEEVGPRYTTVKAIAERAGVERLTVYRHFENEAEMFSACSQHHMELNPPPQSTTWEAEREPVERTRLGLEAIYAFFTRTGSMFEKVYRDADAYDSLRTILTGFDAHLRSLADSLSETWPRDKERTRREQTLRHAVKYSTWRAFEDDGLDDDGKVALILNWLGSPSEGS